MPTCSLILGSLRMGCARSKPKAKGDNGSGAPSGMDGVGQDGKKDPGQSPAVEHGQACPPKQTPTPKKETPMPKKETPTPSEGTPGKDTPSGSVPLHDEKQYKVLKEEVVAAKSAEELDQEKGGQGTGSN